MKPEHAKEASELVIKHQQAHKLISDMQTASSIITKICGRNINIDNRNPAFNKIRNALIEVEQQSIAQMVRRGNQIGLHL